MTVDNAPVTSTGPPPKATIALVLPWTGMMLDYTDQVAALVPETLLDWRLSDPSGKWHFSLAEIAMHIADARQMFARQLSGSDKVDDYWSTGPGTDGVWPFRAYETKQAILDSLTRARGELRPFFERPAADLTATTDGTVLLYERALGKIRDKGQDTAAMEVRGPANLVRVIMAMIVHESGHRSSLQTLLRMHGLNVPED